MNPCERSVRVGTGPFNLNSSNNISHTVISVELKYFIVDLLFRTTPVSTCLSLEYPSSNPDEREIFVTSSAGAFTPGEVQNLEAKNIVIGGSMHGEIGPDILKELYKKETSRDSFG